MSTNYDEATKLFLWLGFQLSDDNDCHRFTSGPVAYITSKLDEAEARGKNSVEPWQEAACENGHHDHACCAPECSCWGAGQSRIEKAEEEAETAFARGRAAGLEQAACEVGRMVNPFSIVAARNIRALIQPGGKP